MRAVITGSNVGVGFATAKVVAALPQWHVVLACKNASKANAALAEIRKVRPDSNVSLAPLDLFSFATVRRFPTLLTEMSLPPLGGLILNAGGIHLKARSLEFTADGSRLVGLLRSEAKPHPAQTKIEMHWPASAAN